MKIYDCFTYFNEIDLLKYRISHCYEFVTYFIIIQASETHRGQKHDFKLNLDLIDSKFHDKIIFNYIDFPPELVINKDITNDDINNLSWNREKYQREEILETIKKNNTLINDDDLCIISDLDEICNYSILLKYLEEYNLFDKISHHINPTFVYNINFLQSNYWHAATFSAPYKYIHDKILTDIRFSKDKFINGELIKNYQSFMNRPSFLYTYDNQYCFNYFNRFNNPLSLFIKENAMAEGGNETSLSIQKLRENIKRILNGEYEAIIEVDYIFSTKIYEYLHEIHTMKKNNLTVLYNQIKDLNDKETIVWCANNFNYKLIE